MEQVLAHLSAVPLVGWGIIGYLTIGIVSVPLIHKFIPRLSALSGQPKSFADEQIEKEPMLAVLLGLLWPVVALLALFVGVGAVLASLNTKIREYEKQ